MPVKVGIGLSGGVDSAVTAIILREQGYDVVGYTMVLGRPQEERSLAEAREAAENLGIKMFVCDFASQWHDSVIEDIRCTYRGGKTPNPCVRCNETVKLNLLPRKAFEDGCSFFATGHYARIVKASSDGVRLLRAIDRTKDQSYFLYRVSPDILSRMILPLGGMLKTEVREFAKEKGLVLASRNDSQDFCGGDPKDLISLEERIGEIVDISGRVLGQHRGYWHYTVGMRKGLGIGGGIPYYVVRLNAERNEVVVAYKEHSRVHKFSIGNCRWLCSTSELAQASNSGALKVKVRSAGEPRGPVRFEGNDCYCDEPMMGVAPGQSAVFYLNDEVLGGGEIM